MGNRQAQPYQSYGYNDPYLSQYGTGYGYTSDPGLAGYGAPSTFYEEPWSQTYWTETYVPTVAGGQRRPVIYVAVPWSSANPLGGLGGFGSGLPMGGGLPFGGGLSMGGGLPFGGGFSMGGGLPFGGGFGANLGNQGLQMVTATLGGFGGSPFGGGFGGGGLSLF